MAAPSDGSTRTATIASLDGLADDLVRVGGRIVDVAAGHFTLDDGTARLSVRLADGVQLPEPDLQVGDVVNVVGRVRARAPGGIELMVHSAADILTTAGMREDTTGTGSPDRALLAASVGVPDALDGLHLPPGMARRPRCP